MTPLWKEVKKTLTLPDMALIIILLITSFLLFITFNRSGKNQNVLIYQDSKLVEIVKTNTNRFITLQGATVQIMDGKVRILKSSCKNQICVKQGWSKGLPIVCVPNKILIRFEDDSENILITK